MAELYRASGEIETVTPKKGERCAFTLPELQALVGGYIEMVYLTNRKILVCNEDGKLTGLPYNPNATVYVRSNGLADIIVGDVLIVNRREVR